MILSTHGIVGSQITQFVGLLDEYPGARTAFSLRKLRTAYTGSAIRVRIDTTGQPEYNIGFVNNELDVATLEGYCTGGLNAYVTTWYDQSGVIPLKDAINTTAANQPQIVSSGSVILVNGKPAIQFNNSQRLIFQTALTTYNNMAVFFVNKHNTTNNSIALTLHDFAQAIYLNWYDSTKDETYYGDGYIYNGPIGSANTNRELMTLYSNSTDGFLQKNNNQLGTRANYTSLSATVHFINGYSGGLRADMSSQELIIYNNNNQTSNISGINSNINSFYSIY